MGGSVGSHECEKSRSVASLYRQGQYQRNRGHFVRCLPPIFELGQNRGNLWIDCGDKMSKAITCAYTRVLKSLKGSSGVSDN